MEDGLNLLVLTSGSNGLFSWNDTSYSSIYGDCDTYRFSFNEIRLLIGPDTRERRRDLGAVRRCRVVSRIISHEQVAHVVSARPLVSW